LNRRKFRSLIRKFLQQEDSSILNDADDSHGLRVARGSRHRLDRASSRYALMFCMQSIHKHFSAIRFAPDEFPEGRSIGRNVSERVTGY
jgi:hypothetical protein